MWKEIEGGHLLDLYPLKIFVHKGLVETDIKIKDEVIKKDRVERWLVSINGKPMSIIEGKYVTFATSVEAKAGAIKEAYRIFRAIGSDLQEGLY